MSAQPRIDFHGRDRRIIDTDFDQRLLGLVRAVETSTLGYPTATTGLLREPWADNLLEAVRHAASLVERAPSIEDAAAGGP